MTMRALGILALTLAALLVGCLGQGEEEMEISTTTTAPSTTTEIPKGSAVPAGELGSARPGGPVTSTPVNVGPGIGIANGTLDSLGSTIATNGDTNPHGLAIVPESNGRLVAGNILVVNYNNAENQLGTGTSIMQISTAGSSTLFTTINETAIGLSCPGGIGLSSIAILKRGWVLVGSLPTSDGTIATARPGCILVLNSDGDVVGTWNGNLINGPWGITLMDYGYKAYAFITNVLNGDITQGASRVVNQGSVLRLELDVPERRNNLPPRILTRRIIGSGFGQKADAERLVIGPTALGLGIDGSTLYVTDSLYNRISGIPNALLRNEDSTTGLDVTANGDLLMPLGLVLGGNGNLVTINGGNDLLVETTPAGTQIDKKHLLAEDEDGAGRFFGLTINGRSLYFTDSRDNTLKRLRI